MAYEYFFSYSRDDWNPYMEAFFEALKEEVRARLGRGRADPVAFRDDQEIDLGQPWRQSLLDALQSSKVLVAVYTPRYFTREYCGREVQFFLNRQRLLGAAPPNAFIIPVIWQPCERDIPPSMAEFQFVNGDFPPEYRQKGFRLLVQNSSFRDRFVESVSAVGERIEAAVRQKTQLPPLAWAPALQDVPDAFMAEGAQAPAEPQAGPAAVQFYYVAGKRSEFASHPEKPHVEPYDTRGGEFWRPSPKGRFLGTMATAVATSKELDLVPYNQPLGNDFLQRLEAARSQNNMVVLFVDAWTLHLLPWYRERMQRDYEHHTTDHSSVLVVWNEDDPDVTEAVRPLLQNRIADTFRINFTREQTFFRPSIANLTELESSLRETLERLRHKIIENAAVARALEGPPKPTLDIHRVPAN